MGNIGDKYQERDHFNKDEDYVAMLYYKYVNDLYSWGLTFTRQKEVIKDCIQDLFVWLLNNRDKLDEIDNVPVYLFTSLRNNLRSVLKEGALNVSDIGIEKGQPSGIMDHSLNILQKLEKDELTYSRRKQIHRLLKGLSAKQKRIIYLRYYMKMDYGEICRILSMNYQSARTLIYRSIKKMRQVYQEVRLLE